MHHEIEILKAKIEAGVLGSREPFARDLVSGKYGYETRGFLTKNQWAWVSRLAADQIDPPKVQIGDLSKLVTMFNTAATNLKYPKFNVTINGGDYQFTLAKPTSKNPNHLYVKRNGVYIGKISPQFEFFGGRDCRPEYVADVQKFAADPEGVAAEHGHLSGNCCFCRKKLTDEKSTEVGYGPVCAKKWGLQWGKKA